MRPCAHLRQYTAAATENLNFQKYFLLCSKAGSGMTSKYTLGYQVSLFMNCFGTTVQKDFINKLTLITLTNLF